MNALKMVCAMALLGACAVDADEAPAGQVEQAATTTDVWTGTWNGGNASASFWSATGGGYVDVFENKTRDYRSAYINFSTWSYDPSSLQCFTWTDWFGNSWDYCYYTRYTYAYGWGSLTPSDVQLNPGTASVHTTLGSTVYGYQCTFDWSSWSGDPCTTLSGGTIDMRWNKDGVSSFFQSGTAQQSYGPYSFKTQGTYRSSSARVSGSLLGLDISGAYGTFGDTRGVTVSKTVQKTPNP